MPDRLATEPWGLLPDGSRATLFTLRNAHGTTVQVSDFGALLVSIRTKDRHGDFEEITRGTQRCADYHHNPACFGALVGRVANRIGHGRFTLDGQTYQVACNNGSHHIHGGAHGFHQHRWSAEPFEMPTTSGVVLTRVSPNGEEGYPGALAVTATYTLTDDDALTLDLHATTDAPTLVNLTQHTYFNLDGPDADVREHRLTVHADAFLPTDATYLPTGEIRPVAGTPFDLRSPTRLGDRLTAEVIATDAQLTGANGYDHNYVLGMTPTATPELAAEVAAPTSGRTLAVWTTEPGIQVFTGHGPHAALALETQHFPDAPNQPDFPSIVLRPGESYASQTRFQFGVQAA
ncbi:MAG: aldose epimerase family protein [Bacteroidota bacterium]